MFNKKVWSFLFVALFALTFSTGFVSAADELTGWAAFQDWFFKFVSPIGFENQWTGVVVGILAMIVIFVILLDVAQLALPFSPWVNWVLAAAFVIVAVFIGLIRVVAGWALGIGGLVAGTAGAIAIVLSSVLLLAVIIFMFIGGNWLKKYIQHVRGGRELLRAEQKGDTEAARIAQGFRIGKRVGESAGTG